MGSATLDDTKAPEIPAARKCCNASRSLALSIRVVQVHVSTRQHGRAQKARHLLVSGREGHISRQLPASWPARFAPTVTAIAPVPGSCGARLRNAASDLIRSGGSRILGLSLLKGAGDINRHGVG